MECIALVGRAGSGKSTIGKILAEKLGFTYISTGDIARAMNDKNLAHGRMANEDDMRYMFRHMINECAINGSCKFIIDGMPRTEEQVDFLREVFEEVNFIEIDTAEDIAIERLLTRSRSDDSRQNIKARQDTYNQTISCIKNKILDYYLNGGVKTYKYYMNDDNANIEGLTDQILVYIKTRI